jgi:hypothetical protein
MGDGRARGDPSGFLGEASRGVRINRPESPDERLEYRVTHRRSAWHPHTGETSQIFQSREAANKHLARLFDGDSKYSTVTVRVEKRRVGTWVPAADALPYAAEPAPEWGWVIHVGPTGCEMSRVANGP